jgi:minor histocompatibility antigen H13
MLLPVAALLLFADPGCVTRIALLFCFLQGALAPVLASVSLFGIYLVLKYFPDLSLQTFLDAYFWLLGTAAITGAARPLLKRVMGPLGRPSMQFDVPEGLLLDDGGKSIEQVGPSWDGCQLSAAGRRAEA